MSLVFIECELLSSVVSMLANGSSGEGDDDDDGGTRIKVLDVSMRCTVKVHPFDSTTQHIPS